MRLARPLAAGALAVTALLTAAPAQAAAPAPASDVRCLFPDCDPFWLFRPCGPLIKCP